MTGSGPGSRGTAREPQAILQGGSGPARPIVSWALSPDSPFCII